MTYAEAEAFIKAHGQVCSPAAEGGYINVLTEFHNAEGEWETIAMTRHEIRCWLGY